MAQERSSGEENSACEAEESERRRVEGELRQRLERTVTWFPSTPAQKNRSLSYETHTAVFVLSPIYFKERLGLRIRVTFPAFFPTDLHYASGKTSTLRVKFHIPRPSHPQARTLKSLQARYTSHMLSAMIEFTISLSFSLSALTAFLRDTLAWAMTSSMSLASRPVSSTSSPSSSSSSFLASVSGALPLPLSWSWSWSWPACSLAASAAASCWAAEA